jgi:peptide/nickel transport system substrate-binding protein
MGSKRAAQRARIYISAGTVFAVLLFGFSTSLAAPANTLVVCDDVSDPLTLDPQKQFSEKNHILLQQIFDGLVRFNPDGKIEPALAVSWERMDPLRMRFKLRREVLFHNGEPFNSRAVHFTIQRYLDPRTGFPALGFLGPLASAEIVDDHTVDVITKSPDGLLLNRLAGFILIVPPDYVAEKGDNALRSSPIGTGPFRFERWDKGNKIVLSANQKYWAKGFPKVNGLVFRFIPSDKQVESLISGEVDIVTELPGTRTTETMQSRTAQVIKKETFFTVVGALNFSKGALKDKRVRQALNYGINRDEIIRYDTFGNGRPIATVTMPGEEGHNPKLKPYPYDPAKARALLKEAGYKDGLKLKVLVKEQSARTVGIIKKQLEAIGVEFVIRMATDSSILQDTASGFWDIFFFPCTDPMAHTFFIQSISCYSKSPYSLGKDPKYDAILESMTVTLDASEREKKAWELDEFLYKEALCLFTYQRLRTYGVNRTIKFTPYITGMPHYYAVEPKQ